jgi:hypothetical protein
MDDNPFDPKPLGLLGALGVEPRPNSLLDYLTTPPTSELGISPLACAIAALSVDRSTPAASANPFSDIFGSGLSGSLAPSTPPENSVNALASIFASLPPIFLSPSPLAQGFDSSLNNIISPLAPPAAYAPPPKPKPVAPQTKRKGFFSFHYDDVIRVNNVRNAWKINCPGREDKRQFYDRSLWESVRCRNPEGLKTLIQRGMEHASAVCVLVGTHTWSRPWVRYEIARAVIEKKGLLAVHINGLRHHQRRTADANGENPLHYMGVGCPKPGIYYLYERVGRPVVEYGQTVMQWQWERYSKFTLPVPVPKHMQAPTEGKVVPLSAVTAAYDYVGGRGHENIGHWIDTAALCAGR